MHKSCCPRLKLARDTCQAVKAETVTDVYKQKKQIPHSFIVPRVMCEEHSAGEMYPAQQNAKPGLRGA